jgi:hypothetical protein
LFVELEDYSNPIKGQITVIDYFPLSTLGSGVDHLTKATLSLNEVELTDQIIPDLFKIKKIV